MSKEFKSSRKQVWANSIYCPTHNFIFYAVEQNNDWPHETVACGQCFMDNWNELEKLRKVNA